MNSIKKVLEMYPKLFCKNINTKDFNHLIDEFIKNLLDYEEAESVDMKKLTYNPTPIVELRKQEKRIKTQLPYIPECVKVNLPVVSDTLDIDSDLKYLEDLIQNDSLFATNNETSEPASENLEPTPIEEDDNKSKTKDKHESSKEKTSSKEKSKSSHSRSHDLNSSSKDRSSSKDKSSSSKDEKISSKDERSNNSKDKHRSSSDSHKRSTSSKDAKSHSSSSRSKHSSSHKRSRSKSGSSSHGHSESKRSKHSSSSHKKSQSSTIVISSESSDDDGYDIYNNMDVDEEQDGENLVVNDNLSPKDGKTEKDVDGYDEPEYIRKKKKQRIAHVDIFGVPSTPAPVSNKAKVLNPNERFKQIQEKYKGLNRNAQTTPDVSSSVKISHVPNVPKMLTAKKTLAQTPPPPMNKTSLLMNDILKRTELKKTIAQTSKKNNRVAHVPTSGATATKPMIQVDAKGTRIPLVIRQTCLDRIFALYSKYVPPDLASDRAVQVEMETYEKCHAAKSYQNSIANSILRIRKEQSGFFLGSKPDLR